MARGRGISKMSYLFKLSRLAKAPLCLMVGFSAAFGCQLAARDSQPLTLALVSTGVFILACGAAALNSIQEREYDAAYVRTKNRPLVTGSVSLTSAYLFTFTAITCGLVLLYFCNPSPVPMLLGIVALIIYNGVYTNLKPITEFALIPGGISGALPPFIGWCAAGGALSNPLIWAVMILFFLWQPPHFCLVLLQYREDQGASHRFRNLGTRFSTTRVKRIIAIWLLSFTTVVLFFTALPGLLPLTLKLVITLAAPIFLAVFLYNLFYSRTPRYKLLFLTLNSYLLCLMVVLTLGTTLQA